MECTVCTSLPGTQIIEKIVKKHLSLWPRELATGSSKLCTLSLSLSVCVCTLPALVVRVSSWADGGKEGESYTSLFTLSPCGQESWFLLCELRRGRRERAKSQIRHESGHPVGWTVCGSHTTHIIQLLTASSGYAMRLKMQLLLLIKGYFNESPNREPTEEGKRKKESNSCEWMQSTTWSKRPVWEVFTGTLLTLVGDWHQRMSLVHLFSFIPLQRKKKRREKLLSQCTSHTKRHMVHSSLSVRADAGTLALALAAKVADISIASGGGGPERENNTSSSRCECVSLPKKAMRRMHVRRLKEWRIRLSLC